MARTPPTLSHVGVGIHLLPRGCSHHGWGALDHLRHGLLCQLGGDAHLSNFGAYASPERRLVFDANDFDETLRGPWEWDLKRLACSFMIAGQNLGFPYDTSREVTAWSVRAYREAIPIRDSSRR